MNRGVLRAIVERHAATWIFDEGYRCECSRVFVDTNDADAEACWARHVVSVIYPET